MPARRHRYAHHAGITSKLNCCYQSGVAAPFGVVMPGDRAQTLCMAAVRHRYRRKFFEHREHGNNRPVRT